MLTKKLRLEHPDQTKNASFFLQKPGARVLKLQDVQNHLNPVQFIIVALMFKIIYMNPFFQFIIVTLMFKIIYDYYESPFSIYYCGVGSIYYCDVDVQNHYESGSIYYCGVDVQNRYGSIRFNL